MERSQQMNEQDDLKRYTIHLHGNWQNSRKPEDENACRDDGNKNTNWRWKHDSDTDEDTDEDDDDDNDDESYHVEYTKPKHDLSAQLQKWAEKDTLFNLKIDDTYENISTNYLSGKRWLDAALVGWHMIVLTVTLAVIGFMFLLRFSFESYIIFMMKRLSSFDTYKRILTTPNPNTNFHIYGDASNLTEALMILNSLYAACILVYLAYYLHKYGYLKTKSNNVSLRACTAKDEFTVCRK